MSQIIRLTVIDYFDHLYGEMVISKFPSPNTDGIIKEYYIFPNGYCILVIGKAISVDRLTDYRSFISDTLFCCPEVKIEVVSPQEIDKRLPNWELENKYQDLIEYLKTIKDLEVNEDLSELRNYSPPESQLNILTD